MPEAASENISMLLLASVVLSCPPSLVLAAEHAGDFAERGGKKRMMALQKQ